MWYNGAVSILQESPPWGNNKISDEYKQMFYSEWQEVDDSFRMTIALENFKKIRINEINEECHLRIISGVYSDALGEMHKYDSDAEDQANFLQAAYRAEKGYENWVILHKDWQTKKDNDPNYNVPEPMEPVYYYRIWDTNNITKDMYPHTYAQFLKVLYDGGKQKDAFIGKCSMLKNKIFLATTIEEVDAIYWTDD